ncbi:MAG: tetratricopeptide repeat protein [Chloroflexi bacterium]|nr:tetratricopeptide repeat protein [Chloroflexota bacterium]
MAILETRYLPADRLHAVASGADLPRTTIGSALFADISGFTPITEKLRGSLGARLGAETLAAHLTQVYGALIAQVDRFGGAIISFAGDAITCWFEGEEAPLRAVFCSFALLDAMQAVDQIPLPNDETATIGLKVSIATGTARRFVAGAPTVQRIDALAGSTIARMAAGEGAAERGDVIADVATMEGLVALATVREWREADGERFAVLAPAVDLTASPSAVPLPDVPPLTSLTDSDLRPWLLPAVAGHFEAGLGEYLTELRPAVALFVRFAGIDYDADPDAESKLDEFVRLAQGVVTRYEGSVLQLTIGDKGSYLYAAFGAPYAHEDDAARALDAALEIRAGAEALRSLDPVQIGLSRGIMRTGAYGGETRRTYGVLGDEVNLAARLMARAAPGEILLSETLASARLDAFTLEALAPVQVKGKANPVGLFRLIGRNERTFEARFYTTPLVGREGELESVRAALQPILEGRHAGLIYVYGEPGMGKSRLAFEAQTRLQADAPVTWLTGQTDQLNRAPLSAFRYFLRPYFGQRREGDVQFNRQAFDDVFEGQLELSDEANRADLTLYRSYLAGILGLVIPDSPYASADERTRIDSGIAAIKAWARAESRRRPLVIHLEDAQWLDAISIRAIQQLTYNMDTIPVALLLTSRYNDDATPYSIPAVFGVPVHTLDLNRLTDQGGQAVAEAVLGGAVTDGLARLVRDRAEGNPFFIEQLALDLKERGALSQTDAVWDIRPAIEAEVPSGVNSVLIARLDRLAVQVKAVVQTAAVLGREFDVQVLSRMLRENTQTYIQAAEGEAIWSALDALRYLFRHALLRDAAYQMQVHERLKSLHRLAAETIESLYPDDTAQYDALLDHWQGAGVPDKIIDYTMPVCERMVEMTADFVRAEALLRRALEMGEVQRRAGLLRLLGDAAAAQGHYPEAQAHYDACLAIVGEDAQQRSRALNGLGSLQLRQGSYAQAAEFLTQALTVARGQQDDLGAAIALVNLGETAFNQGDYETALSHFTDSMVLYRTRDARNGLVTALSKMGAVASIRGDYATARTYLQECLAVSRELGSRTGMSAALHNLGVTAMEEGDYQTARLYWHECLALRRETGNRPASAATLGNMAILEHRQGNVDLAIRYAEDSLQTRREIGDRKGIANSLAIIGYLAYDLNEVDDSRRYFEECLQIQRDINERWGMATSLAYLGELALYQDDFVQAQDYLSQGLTIYRQIGLQAEIADGLLTQAPILQALGDTAAARALADEALTLSREINKEPSIARSLACLARLDLANGNAGEAEQRLSEALAIFRRQDDRQLPRVLAGLACAQRLLERSQDDIHALMREALQTLQTKGTARLKVETLIELAPILLADAKDARLGELIGLLLAQRVSAVERLAIEALLGDLRARMNGGDLDAALARGREMNADTLIAALLADLD